MEDLTIIKPLYWGGREDTGKQILFKTGDKHYVASQVYLDQDSYGKMQWETMVFAADEKGTVLNWSDLWCKREEKPTNLENLLYMAHKQGDINANSSY